MSSELTIIGGGAEQSIIAAVGGDLSKAQAALDLLLKDRRSAATQRAYSGDMRAFFVWQGKETSPAAVTELCSLETAQLAGVLNAYAASLRTLGLSESTSNRRLSAVRSLLAIARKLGIGAGVDPSGLVASERVQTYRDTRGPSLAEVKKILAAPDRSTLRGKRDYAILSLLWENAIRRAEVCACNVSDFEPGDSPRLFIVGKGKGTQRAPVTLSPRTSAAIAEYLAARGLGTAAAAEPLFASLDRKTISEQRGAAFRLTGDGLYKLMRAYGAEVGKDGLHPHSMRHAAITAVLDATQGDIRKAQRLSRHKNIQTLTIYDDNRSDLQGEATALLSALA